MVAAVHAARQGELALALTLDYGQRAVDREIEAATAIADELEIEHVVVPVPFIKDLGGSALTDADRDMPVAEQALDDPEAAADRAKQVWVPNRNGLFIHLAACFAEARGLDAIVVGFNKEEAATFPDNSPAYLEACTKSLSFTLNKPVRVTSPTKELDKTGIVRMGKALKAPFHLVWSCYENGPNHCLKCESCRRLKRALEAENIWDEVKEHLT